MNEYQTRFFNTIKEKDNLLIKKSYNKEKIISEFLYYYDNKNLQNFLIQPKNLIVEKNYAEYSMEKINDKDIGYKYVNNFINKNDFNKIILNIKDFKNKNNFIELNKETMFYFANENVINKTIKRTNKVVLYDLNKDNLLNLLIEKFNKYFENRKTFYIVPSHGDMCFSNMFLINDNLKLIDSKGIEYSMMDEYYDLAKISQSWIYGYDFIMYDKPFISKDTDIFFEYLNENNIDKELLDVYTASLFISMCPMHIDRSDRIEKFLDVAEKILKNLD